MPFLSRLMSVWTNLFRRSQVERDLHDELQAYVEEIAERKVQAGFAPEAAREAALLELGGMDRIKDLVRQQRIGFADLRRAGALALVVIVAFLSGAGATMGVMRWNTAKPVNHTKVAPANPWDRRNLPILRGRIVDKTTGEPIPLVEVGLQPAPEIRRFTYTDSEGNFDFVNPPESYQLEAGSHRWNIGYGRQAFGSAVPIPKREFELLLPGDVSVKSIDGQLLEGAPVKFHTGVSKRGTFPPDHQEVRSFPYSRSIMELVVDNLPPGKESSLPDYYLKDH